MTALKINPAKLPDRGAPTRDCRPKPWTIPDDVKVIKVESKAMQTAHEAWKKKRAVHNKRGGKKNNANKWQPEEDEMLIRLWHEGKSAKEIAKSFPDRTDHGIYWRIFYLRDLGRLHIENRKRRF